MITDQKEYFLPAPDAEQIEETISMLLDPVNTVRYEDIPRPNLKLILGKQGTRLFQIHKAKETVADVFTLERRLT